MPEEINADESLDNLCQTACGGPFHPAEAVVMTRDLGDRPRGGSWSRPGP